jgi:YVTN family beta-propeller protein
VGSDPGRVATNPLTNTIYITDAPDGGTGTLSVISGKTNTVVATVTLAVDLFEAPFGVATNPLTNTIYVSNTNADSSGTLSVIGGKTNTVVATVSVGSLPFGVATDPLTNTIYVTNAGSDTVSVLASRRTAAASRLAARRLQG